MDLKIMYQKYKDIFPYIFFGVLTTLVNIIVYWLLAHPLNFGVITSTIIAWVAAVLFAYITNRKWVFHSEATENNEIFKELISFFVCRLATGGLDIFCMYIFAKELKFNDVIIKVSANILVIILNYLLSRLFIFKHK